MKFSDVDSSFESCACQIERPTAGLSPHLPWWCMSSRSGKSIFWMGNKFTVTSPSPTTACPHMKGPRDRSKSPSLGVMVVDIPDRGCHADTDVAPITRYALENDPAATSDDEEELGAGEADCETDAKKPERCLCYLRAIVSAMSSSPKTSAFVASMTRKGKAAIQKGEGNRRPALVKHRQTLSMARTPSEPPMRMRWVLTWKYTGKAMVRLVLHGFADLDLVNLRHNSPTVSRHSRMLPLQSAFNRK